MRRWSRKKVKKGIERKIARYCVINQQYFQYMNYSILAEKAIAKGDQNSAIDFF